MKKNMFLLIILVITIIMSTVFSTPLREGLKDIPDSINQHLYSFKRCSGNNNQHTSLFCHNLPSKQSKGNNQCHCINNKCNCHNNNNNTFLKYKHHFIDNYSLIDNVFDNLRLYYYK